MPAARSVSYSAMASAGRPRSTSASRRSDCRRLPGRRARDRARSRATDPCVRRGPGWPSAAAEPAPAAAASTATARKRCRGGRAPPPRLPRTRWMPRHRRPAVPPPRGRRCAGRAAACRFRCRRRSPAKRRLRPGPPRRADPAARCGLPSRSAPGVRGAGRSPGRLRHPGCRGARRPPGHAARAPPVAARARRRWFRPAARGHACAVPPGSAGPVRGRAGVPAQTAGPGPRLRRTGRRRPRSRGRPTPRAGARHRPAAPRASSSIAAAPVPAPCGRRGTRRSVRRAVEGRRPPRCDRRRICP